MYKWEEFVQVCRMYFKNRTQSPKWLMLRNISTSICPVPWELLGWNTAVELTRIVASTCGIKPLNRSHLEMSMTRSSSFFTGLSMMLISRWMIHFLNRAILCCVLSVRKQEQSAVWTLHWSKHKPHNLLQQEVAFSVSVAFFSKKVTGK